jgi:hypothetical protein
VVPNYSHACVGAALAYLVRRMDTFRDVARGDVLLYKRRDHTMPDRHPAKDVLNAQARHSCPGSGRRKCGVRVGVDGQPRT